MALNLEMVITMMMMMQVEMVITMMMMQVGEKASERAGSLISRLHPAPLAPPLTTHHHHHRRRRRHHHHRHCHHHHHQQLLLQYFKLMFVNFFSGGVHQEKATLLEIKLEIRQHLAKLHPLGQIELFVQIMEI